MILNLIINSKIINYIKSVTNIYYNIGDVVQIDDYKISKNLNAFVNCNCQSCNKNMNIKYKNFYKQNIKYNGYKCSSCVTTSINTGKDRSGVKHKVYNVDYKSIIFKKWNVKLVGDKHRYRDLCEFECETHGILRGSIKNLLRSGCTKCNYENSIEIEFKLWLESVKMKHNNFYTYDKVIYKSSKRSVIITCPKHGDFNQIPNNHYNGSGCKYCNYLLHIDEFIEIGNNIHDGKYKYDLVEYKNSDDLVKIYCPSHGYFDQKVRVHLSGHGCKKCNSSNGEIKISGILDGKNISYIREYKFPNFPNKFCEYDFYLPSYNICIEYDGIQHFKPIEFFGGVEVYNKTVELDTLKNNFCLDNNIKLYRISYLEDIDSSIDKIIKMVKVDHLLS